MLKLSKQQKPTNREAFNPIIETQPRSHETRDPICVGQIVENDQTAHISLQIFNFQRARRQNRHHASITSVTFALHPDGFGSLLSLSIRTVTSLPASVKRCLGKAAKSRKRKKTGKSHFFQKHESSTISWGWQTRDRYLAACPIANVPCERRQLRHARAASSTITAARYSNGSGGQAFTNMI